MNRVFVYGTLMKGYSNHPNTYVYVWNGSVKGCRKVPFEEQPWKPGEYVAEG